MRDGIERKTPEDSPVVGRPPEAGINSSIMKTLGLVVLVILVSIAIWWFYRN
jgi:hypothetical protein